MRNKYSEAHQDEVLSKRQRASLISRQIHLQQGLLKSYLGHLFPLAYDPESYSNWSLNYKDLLRFRKLDTGTLTGELA